VHGKLRSDPASHGNTSHGRSLQLKAIEQISVEKNQIAGRFYALETLRLRQTRVLRNVNLKLAAQGLEQRKPFEFAHEAVQVYERSSGTGTQQANARAVNIYR
jgi:hypothetical protein